MCSDMESHSTPFDIDTLKRAFGAFPTGITIVTSLTEAGPVGFTCQAFNALSLDPPLISLSVMATSSSYPLIRACGRFGVNVLGEGQHELALRFGARGLDRWQDVEWSPGEGGSPRMVGSVASFDCELWAEHEAGDHLIVIGRVRKIHLPEEDHTRDPLVYTRSVFRHLTPPRGRSKPETNPTSNAPREAARSTDKEGAND